MGSKTWISLSVLSLALTALVGCPSTDKRPTGSYVNPTPVAKNGVAPPNFPTGQGQVGQQQGQQQPFPQGLQNGQPLQTGGNRPGVGTQQGGPPLYNPQYQPTIQPAPYTPTGGVQIGPNGLPKANPYDPGFPGIGGTPPVPLRPGS